MSCFQQTFLRWTNEGGRGALFFFLDNLSVFSFSWAERNSLSWKITFRKASYYSLTSETHSGEVEGSIGGGGGRNFGRSDSPGSKEAGIVLNSKKDDNFTKWLTFLAQEQESPPRRHYQQMDSLIRRTQSWLCRPPRIPRQKDKDFQDKRF